MSKCENGCGKKVSFSQLRADLATLEQRDGLGLVPKELIMAIAIKESGGNRFFGRNEQQYIANMAVLSKGLNVVPGRWLERVVSKSGPLQGMIPKFRYEPSWKAHARELAGKTDDIVFWSQMLPVSFGYGQKGMLWYLSGYTSDQWNREFYKFLADPYLQLKVISKDMEKLIRISKGEPELALTRYNAGSSAKHVSDYGRRVFNLYQSLIKVPDN